MSDGPMSQEQRARLAALAELECALHSAPRERRFRMRRLVSLLLKRVNDHRALVSDILAGSAEHLPDVG